MVWGASIAWYLFLAGLGGGAYLTAALMEKWYPNAGKTIRAGYILAPIVVAIGLLLLMTDAKGGFLNPLRFLLLVNNLGSVMSWGVIFLFLFMVISVIVAIRSLLGKANTRFLSISGIVLACCVAAYTGVLLGVVHTYPLWNNALLPILFVVSAFSTGAAAVLLSGSILEPEQVESMKRLTDIHAVFPIVETVLVVSLLAITATVGVSGYATVSRLLVGDYAVLFWVGFLIVGLVGPIVIEAMGRRAGGISRGLSMAGDAGVLVGGFLLRFLVVTAVVPLALI